MRASPRFLLLWLLYVAYLMTRRLSTTGQTGTIGAVLAVFAAVDVPIVYFSIQWWRTQHPSPVLTGDGQLDPVMRHIFGLNFLAWAVWGMRSSSSFAMRSSGAANSAHQAATLAAIRGDHSTRRHPMRFDGFEHHGGPAPRLRLRHRPSACSLAMRATSPHSWLPH